MCNNENNFSDLLEKILLLQQNKNNIQSGCNKPFLGNGNPFNANTRPLNIYCCCTNKLWEMPYTYNGIEGISNTFRIESLNNNIATFRILAENNNILIATDNYFMLNLNYVSAIKCLNDILIQNIE